MNEVAYNLRPVWDALLNIYTEFAKICDRHHLRYYVTGGTLLGAVRHDGFIPWDDDFDVVMPRPDFQKFVSLAAEMPKGLWLSYGELNPDLPIDFAQLYEGRQEVNDRVRTMSHLDIKWGVYIDVIPIDGMPCAFVPFYWWAFKRSLWRRAIHGGGIVWRMLARMLGLKFNGREGRVAFAQWLASYDYETSPCVEDYNANKRRFKARALSAQSFGEPIMHRFDSISVPLPHEWDKFLRLIFGNYMVLPPPEKRVPSHNVL